MDKQSMIDRLFAEYSAERAAALMDADARRKEIAKKAPIYADMEARLRLAIREGLEKGKDDPEAGRRAIMAMRDEARSQLAAAGYTLDDLRPRYKCHLCEDTGLVGMPEKRFCECFRRRLNLMQMRDAELNIPETTSFANFNADVFPELAPDGTQQRAQMVKVGRWAERWAECFSRDEHRNVLLYGGSGLGKTYAMDCIVRRVVERGFSAVKLTAYRLGEQMRRHHMSNGGDDLFGLCLSVDLMAIDDLGSEPMFENVTVEYLYVLLSERQAAGRPTIITTNLTTEKLKSRYTERIASRIINGDNILIRLTGEDVRRAGG